MKGLLAALFLSCALFCGQALAAPDNLSTDIAPKDCSGTITSGGTAQNAITANHFLHGIILQNLDTAEPLWYSTNGNAAANTAGSFALPANTATTFAGTVILSLPGFNSNLSVVAATTGHKFSCTRF